MADLLGNWNDEENYDGDDDDGDDDDNDDEDGIVERVGVDREVKTRPKWINVINNRYRRAEWLGQNSSPV